VNAWVQSLAQDQLLPVTMPPPCRWSVSVTGSAGGGDTDWLPPDVLLVLHPTAAADKATNQPLVRIPTPARTDPP
jgi:hypothetical protein